MASPAPARSPTTTRTPSLSIGDVTVNEAAGTATFTVTLSAASGQTVTVNYGTSNGTARPAATTRAASGTLTFAPGVTTQTITVAITNDTVFEGATGETFNVVLSGASNATIADGTGRRHDHRQRQRADHRAVSSPPARPKARDLVYTVTLSNASSTATGLAYSLGGGSAPPAPTTAPCQLQQRRDAGRRRADRAGRRHQLHRDRGRRRRTRWTKPAETVPLTIGGVTGTGTITDDDAAPTLTVSNVSVAENAGYAVFSVELSNPSSGAVSLDLSFANGTAVGGGGTSNNTDYGNNTRMQVSTDGGVTWSARARTRPPSRQGRPACWCDHHQQQQRRLAECPDRNIHADGRM